MRRIPLRWLFLGAFAALVGVYLMLPTLIVIPMSLNASSVLGVFGDGWTLAWFEQIISDRNWGRTAFTSLQVALGTVVLATSIGTAAALGLQRVAARWRLPITAVIVSPMIIPPVIIGIGTYVLYLKWYLDGSVIGLILAHSVLALPFVVVTVTATLSQLDPVYDRAAASLGAGPWTRFRRVTVPLIAPGMFAGALFAFVMSWDEVVVSIFLTDAQSRTLPVFMWTQIRTQLTPTLAAVGVFLTVLSIVALVSMRRLQKGND
ncbi:ABC transporter permease [Leucobacter celer]|jgi:putative spermidine/putrescine transport system permease protein|uniref:ABC transporter permease n=1 Tax=Leucobacter celer TaxID=668625 RepID=UPI0006A78DC1|nr:ABC transporter permease [Leucobacter celer]